MKVLVVENSSAICERLLELLIKSGIYEGLGCVACSMAVLELVETCRPDALLLDLRLDGSSGFRVLEMLRSRGLSLPIIMLSTSHGWQYQIHALARGADAFLCKSSQFEEIVPTLNRLLAARPANPAGAAEATV